MDDDRREYQAQQLAESCKRIRALCRVQRLIEETGFKSVRWAHKCSLCDVHTLCQAEETERPGDADAGR